VNSISTVLVKVEPRTEKVGRFYIDTTWNSETDTAEKEWKRECDYILNEIIETNERQTRNKMTDREVLAYARKFYPSKPQKKQSLGTDRYNTVHGTVLAVPKRLPKDMRTKQMPKIEVEVGDDVYFHFLAIPNAQEKGAVFGDQVFINYSSIFFAIREGKIVMVNGWTLMEEIEAEPLSKVIIDPHKRTDTKKGIVRHVPHGSDLKDGDVAYWTKTANVKLEYEMIATLPKPYLRVREESIVALEA